MDFWPWLDTQYFNFLLPQTYGAEPVLCHAPGQSYRSDLNGNGTTLPFILERPLIGISLELLCERE
jgi:hypothetical protein